MSMLGAAYTPEPDKPERDAWYACPHCPYRTKQRKGLPQVAHNCPKKRALVNMKEETDEQADPS